MDVQGYIAERQPLVNDALERALPPPDASPEGLHGAMRHLIFPGGKRLRPMLALAAAEAVGAPAATALPRPLLPSTSPSPAAATAPADARIPADGNLRRSSLPRAPRRIGRGGNEPAVAAALRGDVLPDLGGGGGVGPGPGGGGFLSPRLSRRLLPIRPLVLRHPEVHHLAPQPNRGFHVPVVVLQRVEPRLPVETRHDAPEAIALVGPVHANSAPDGAISEQRQVGADVAVARRRDDLQPWTSFVRLDPAQGLERGRCRGGSGAVPRRKRNFSRDERVGPTHLTPAARRRLRGGARRPSQGFLLPVPRHPRRSRRGGVLRAQLRREPGVRLVHQSLESNPHVCVPVRKKMREGERVGEKKRKPHRLSKPRAAGDARLAA